MIRLFGFAFLLVCCMATVHAQQADLLLNDETYHFLDRIDIKGLTGRHLPTDLKPYGREAVAEWLQSVDTSRLRRREVDWLRRTRFLADDSYAPNQESGWIKKTFLKKLYTNRRDLVGVQQPDFTLFLNPILYLSYGTDRYAEATGNTLTSAIWRNTRGISVRGALFGKVGYYGELLEQQQRFPQFFNSIIAQTGTIPGEGWYKLFRTTGYDFPAIRGYLTYSPVKQLRIKFGRDRAFWGNGSQSLVLSDFSTDYTLLNLSLKIWKIEYTTQFSQFADFIPYKPDVLGSYPAKYGAFHYLAYRPSSKFSIGIFESTIFAPVQANGTRGFNIQYLNPILFYRAIEAWNGSPDNTNLGLMFKANIRKAVQLYGQLLIDDLSISQRTSGWWGNKLGGQLGFKWIDVAGIETLDLQAEANAITPFTYTHFNNGSNYSHYGQYLGHALGTNLLDVNGTLQYQPIPRLYLYLRYAYVQQGRNATGPTGEINTGGNVFNPAPPANQFGNKLLQGEKVTLQSLNTRVTYQLGWQSLYFDLEGIVRREGATNSVSVFGSLRYFIPWRPTLF